MRTGMSTPYPGLTSSEVAQRVRAGQVNRLPASAWTDYARIIGRNVFTVFNGLVTPAAAALFYVGKYQGAVAVCGMAVSITVIGLAQEIRAKWHLAKLAILVETMARVRRDGKEMTIPAAQVVKDDLVLLGSGEAVVADGTVIESEYLDVDEALLTGESDPARRREGDRLLSGSFCVAGHGSYRTNRVGAEAFAQNTTAQARAYRYAPSPLTRELNRIVNVLTCIAVGLCLIYVVLLWLGRCSEAELVQNIAATITSMVPQGLVLTATIAFTLGAVQLSLRGAVVQRLSAVESMASIDVICTDKTGTLTTNRLALERTVAVGPTDDIEGRRLLALFASTSVDRSSKTLQALLAALGEVKGERLDALPFQSRNRFSAVRVRDCQHDRLLVLGACEALRPYLNPLAGNRWEQMWKESLPSGLRLLLFTEADNPDLAEPGTTFGNGLDGLVLRPVLLVALSDELRPTAPAVLEALAEQGIAFKIISGDNPETVRATVSKLRLAWASEPVVSGDQLDKAPGQVKEDLIAKCSVFGRIEPRQKMEIVTTLQQQGRRVAMIGDGVNDVLPIKAADLGIAMGEGTQASKTVSSLVLENNDFGLLPHALDEGRLILRNLRRSAKLFLVKNVYSLLLILAYVSGIGGLPFPYEPQQVTLLNWLVIGLPALVIAISRQRPKVVPKQDFLREVGWFAVSSGVVFAVAGAAAVWFGKSHFDADVSLQRTLLLSVLILLGATAVPRALLDPDAQSLDGNYAAYGLAAAALPLYMAAMYLPLTARFFQLTPLSLGNWVLVGAVVGPAAVIAMGAERLLALVLK
jgi:cation-transporting ATPase E